MNDDFYFEESNPRKTKFIIVGILVVISLVVVFFIYYRNTYILSVRKKVTVEVGSTISYDVNDYVLSKIIDESDYKISFSGLDNDEIFASVGEYTFKVKYKNITKSGKLVVEDNTPPTVVVNNLTVGVDEEFEVDDFITSCEDYSMPCTVKYKNEADENLISSDGVYTIELVISDKYDNKITKEVTLEVKKGYSRLNIIKSDLTIDHTEPSYDDWEGQMIISYNEAINPNEVEASSEKYNEYMDILSSDLHQYMDELYVNNLITETEVIEVYNKYDYIIGYAIRVKLDNGIYIYLTK